MKAIENLTWISVPALDGYHIIEIEDIIYLEAKNSRTMIFLGKTKFIESNEPLKHYEKKLKGKNFLRIHHSYIINLKYLARFFKGKVAYALLILDIRLTVTGKYRDALVAILERER